MNKRIIGITGPAYGGKDTTADYVARNYPKYEKYSFATPMKEMLREGLGLTEEQLHGTNAQKEVVDPRYSRTSRYIMQTIGTEWGRKLIHPDIWVNALDQRIGAGFAVIADVRFENEAAFVRENGFLIHLSGRSAQVRDHVSEAGVEFDAGANDVRVSNDANLATLYMRVQDVLNIFDINY